MTLLPTPEPPMMVRVSPEFTARLRPAYTTFEPNDLHTFSKRMIGSFAEGAPEAMAQGPSSTSTSCLRSADSSRGERND